MSSVLSKTGTTNHLQLATARKRLLFRRKPAFRNGIPPSGEDEGSSYGHVESGHSGLIVVICGSYSRFRLQI
ncbi:uncharacterized protein C8R40DRAFT_1108828 [Lentinula edodes]|uniref:uncharacterized protein n=1 Tax=Lentinula edodes TaxID=5353 RepID=UPI001E8D8747|nr:uncharacterized protein C8R40DRAFT_1108828 [Lentinula edodes]KAH7874425.1 hypothetical protein C8R40DRAFT_1108828 [Lentinula edodes]